MKRARRWVSLLCTLIILSGCFACCAAAEESVGISAEEARSGLRIRIDGPDSRMPVEISYKQFTDGSYKLEGLKPGVYTITEITPEELLEGFELQDDSIITIKVTVEGNKQSTAELFNHYVQTAIPEHEESTEAEPGEGTEETPEEYVSVTVRKEWDDQQNAMGIRPDSVTVILSNGSSYELNEGNDWNVTVDHLPAMINGEPVKYTWKETEVPGYTLAYVLSNGNFVTLVNRLWQPPKLSEGKKQPKRTGDTWIVLDDYETPLGLEIMINHVGDCYE